MLVRTIATQHSAQVPQACLMHEQHRLQKFCGDSSRLQLSPVTYHCHLSLLNQADKQMATISHANYRTKGDRPSMQRAQPHLVEEIASTAAEEVATLLGQQWDSTFSSLAQAASRRP